LLSGGKEYEECVAHSPMSPWWIPA
jgi:hypothetical protein